MTSSSPQRRIATRVGSLAVADEGAGTAVVFWPSLFSDHRLFGHVCRLLGDGWRTLRIDGPGFGRSDPPRGDVQAGAYADAVVDVLDALGIDAAFVAGCSWGGQIAVQAGVRHPHRVRGVLAMNAPLEASRGGQPLEVLGTRWLGSTEFWGRGVARAMLSAASRRAHPERVLEFAGAFPDFDRRAAATTVRTVMSRFPGLEAVLPQLAVPATLLFGVEDRLCPLERMRPLARLAPTATLEIVPECGHLAPLEAPEAVVAALEALAARATHGVTASTASGATHRLAAAESTPPPEPLLAPPGAGLPAVELFAARAVFRLRRLTGSRRSFDAHFARERARIAALVGCCSAEAGARRVLIRRVAGLEDSSRFWSVWMTLDHLRIVHELLAQLIGELVHGVAPPGAASTAAVKPSPTAGPEVVAAYEASCDALMEVCAAAPDLHTAARYPHPWFGPLDAAGWHALAATHLGVHRVQLERILAGL